MQQRITDLVDTCASYWELRGIAPERRAEMRLELEYHLRQAVADGKALDAVVGSNPLAFAEAWARELPHRASGGMGIVLRWVAYRWLAYVLAFLGGIALVDHVLFRALTFPFTVTHVVIVVFFAVLGLLEAGGGFLALRIRTRERRQELIFALYVLISVLLLVGLRLAGLPFQATLFRWAWPITVLVLSGAAGLFWLKARFARDKRREQQP
jgi:hypothetical protein